MFIYYTLLGNHTYPANTTGKETDSKALLLHYPWSTGKDSLAHDYAIPTGIHLKEVLATTNWIKECRGQG